MTSSGVSHTFTSHGNTGITAGTDQIPTDIHIYSAMNTRSLHLLSFTAVIVPSLRIFFLQQPATQVFLCALLLKMISKYTLMTFCWDTASNEKEVLGMEHAKPHDAAPSRVSHAVTCLLSHRPSFVAVFCHRRRRKQTSSPLCPPLSGEVPSLFLSFQL